MDFAHVHAVQIARRGERAKQPRVLLVAGEDLIAACQLEPSDDLRHALAVQVVSATSAASAPSAVA